MNDRKLPRMSQTVMVWPAMRTVRTDDKQPVMQDGEPLMKPARVRDASGNLITGPTLVLVDAYYFKLINQRALDWCTREEHLANTRATAAPAEQLSGDAAAAPEVAEQAASGRKARKANEEQPIPVLEQQG